MVLEVRPIEAEAVYSIRGEVLRQGQPPGTWRFGCDSVPGAFHLGAFVDGALAGVVTLAPEESPLFPAESPWRLRGMAVLPGWRGRGAGGTLLREAVRALRGRGADLVWCNARVSAAGFYEKHGFCGKGGRFVIEGIGEHLAMARQLR